MFSEGAGAVNVDYPSDDIEAVWVYHYISYSRVTKKSIGFFKFLEQNPTR